MGACPRVLAAFCNGTKKLAWRRLSAVFSGGDRSPAFICLADGPDGLRLRGPAGRGEGAAAALQHVVVALVLVVISVEV